MKSKAYSLFIITLLACSVIMVTAGASETTLPIPNEYDMIAHGRAYYNLPKATTLSTLEDISDVIVKGEVIENVDQIIFEDGIAGYTTTSVNIIEVYKGNVNAGENIIINEDYVISDYNNQKLLFSMDGYMPSEVEQEYVFFLNATDAGTYNMHNSIMGRYPVPSSAQNPATRMNAAAKTDLPLNEKADLDNYNNLMAEVLNKYNQK